MIKNLKTYNIKKKTKYSLICAALLSGTLILTACGPTHNAANALYTTTGNENDFEKIESVYQQNNVTEDSGEYSVEGSVPLNDVSNSKSDNMTVKLTKEDLNYFNNYLNSNTVNYDYSNLYELDKAIAMNNNYVKPSSYSSKLSNITGKELYDVVLENNKKYLKETQIKTYHEFGKKELQVICNKIADVCNNQISESKDINVNELKSTLSNLKIFESGGSFCNGYVTFDYCFIISPNMTNLLNMMDEENDMGDIVTHETIHIIQMDSPESYDINTNLVGSYGFVREFKDLKVNSLNNLWLIEASAEKCMCSYENQEAITYQNFINYMESFAMINLVNDNYKVNDAEHLVYKDNLSDLYNFFGAKTDSEKREVLNMMYSVEIMQQQPDDFYQVYDEYLGHEATADEIAALNNELRSDVCQTFNRIFYRNLANKLTEENIDLNDIFYLISTYEMDLNNHISYDVYDCYYRNETLMNNYVDMQDEFFNLIANRLNISYDEVVNLYNSYTAKSNNGDNYNLSWLSEDKKDYIDERKEDLSKAISVSLRNSNEQFKKYKEENKTK